MSDEFDWIGADLIAEFHSRLSGDAATLTALIRQAEDASRRAAAVEEIASIAHKLAGMAGTFGAPEISEAGRAVENTASRVDPSAELPSVLVATVARLQEAIAARLPPQPPCSDGADRGTGKA